jgi:type IV fimbrial biogenesis protein FimT
LFDSFTQDCAGNLFSMKLSCNSCAQCGPRLGGFTLIELLVTLTVAGILLSVAAPSFKNFVLNDRDTSQANSLVYSLNYARSEAVKMNSSTGVTVCPSSDGLTCNNGNSWATGWIVFDTLPGQATANILQAIPATSGSNTLNGSGTGQAGVQFTSSGQLAGPATSLQITICDARGASYARDVEVNTTGRVAASQNLGLSVSGAALVCPAVP